MNDPRTWMLSLPIGLFCLMVAATRAGYRVAIARSRRLDGEAAVGTGAIDAAVLGLLGLLIAFWFSSAGTRLDMRRSLIVEEANAIGTAWLRLALLPEDVQPIVRGLVRDHLDVRLQQAPAATTDASNRLAARADEVQSAIWRQAVAAAPRCESDQAAVLMLASLNEMFDAAARHQAAYDAHTPTLILVLVLVVAALSGLLAGHDMGNRRPFNWLHALALATVVSLTVWVIYDLEMPRYGLIRVDNYDHLMRDLRDGFATPDARAVARGDAGVKPGLPAAVTRAAESALPDDSSPKAMTPARQKAPSEK